MVTQAARAVGRALAMARLVFANFGLYGHNVATRPVGYRHRRRRWAHRAGNLADAAKQVIRTGLARQHRCGGTRSHRLWGEPIRNGSASPQNGFDPSAEQFVLRQTDDFDAMQQVESARTFTIYLLVGRYLS